MKNRVLYLWLKSSIIEFQMAGVQNLSDQFHFTYIYIYTHAKRIRTVQYANGARVNETKHSYIVQFVCAFFFFFHSNSLSFLTSLTVADSSSSSCSSSSSLLSLSSLSSLYAVLAAACALRFTFVQDNCV